VVSGWWFVIRHPRENRALTEESREWVERLIAEAEARRADVKH
jgi:hypothetical protein